MPLSRHALHRTGNDRLLAFGAGDRGIRVDRCYRPQVVKLGRGVSEEDLATHDEQGPLGYLMMLAEMRPPEFPVPIGVIRRIQRPTSSRWHG